MEGKLYTDPQRKRGVVEWRLDFDRKMQRTRLTFGKFPGRDIISAVKAAGFAWRADFGEWRRGYNETARRAALELVSQW